MIWIKLGQNQRRLALIIIVLIVALLLGFGGWLVYRGWQLEPLTVKSPVAEELIQNRVLYAIDKGEGDVSEYQIEISNDSTVFSLLEELAQREGFEITFTHYDFGVFIENIDGIKSGQNNKYWLYWVNHQLGEVAADKKQVKEGDIIE